MILNIVAFLSYLLLALGVGLASHSLWPALGLGGAILLACTIFLAGALIHEGVDRRRSQTESRRQIMLLKQSARHTEEELRWARREMRSLLSALEDSGIGRSSASQQAALDEVMTEVRMLRSLVEDLSGETGNAGSRQVLTRTETEDDMPLDAEEVLPLVREALSHDRVDVVLQPIVSLPQRKRRFYECFTRLRDGEGNVLLPEVYLSVARQAGLVAAIDNMLLFRCIQLVRGIQRRHASVDFFCNLSVSTLHDEDFFADFVDYLGSHRELAANLVFEFPQEDLDQHGPRIRELLEQLHDLGCRFSLDRIRDLYLDLDDLAARHIAFVKIEADVLQSLAQARGSHAVVGLITELSESDIDLIVEKIEDEKLLKELLDYGIDFGQGYLFGEPRFARPAA
ncbi:EAL domain-containing protein [Fodinicurvata sediminis]|uniref:EAL domain-containing protein n=1 Tax=Fodinicurvata sediminis TaxID=1121832 RepID=UPI0003B35577|nr:EAL domain-containing protein [Fodinicurvata sediminis]